MLVSYKHQHEAAVDIHYVLPSQSDMVEMFERFHISLTAAHLIKFFHCHTSCLNIQKNGV